MKMMTKKISSLLYLTFGIFFVCGFILFGEVPKVLAVPLTPGSCYSRINGEFVSIACPAAIEIATDQCAEVRQMPGGDTANRYYDIDCATGNQGSDITPSSATEDTAASSDGGEAGTLSGEGEEDRVVNSCDGGDQDCQKKTCKIAERETLTTQNCIIIEYLVTGINFLSALAGMAIVASIMMGGYQYMTAKDNSGQVEAARKRITWAMIALGIFIFMYAGLNYLVPGGIL